MPTALTAAATSMLLAFTNTTGSHHKHFQHVPQGCSKHYTIPMAKRAINATYRGARDVTAYEAHHVHLYIRCQWSTRHRPELNHDLATAIHQWRARRSPPWQTAYVSYYYGAAPGNTCCGYYNPMGVAVCGQPSGVCVPIGTQIEFEYDGRTVIATADDHGPYVAGRQFDLSVPVKEALGFPGLGYVKYRILH